MSFTKTPRLCRRVLTTHASLSLSFERSVYSAGKARHASKDNAIPFAWEQDGSAAEEHREKKSTITPAEAKIFQGIFNDIAQGRLPSKKKRSGQSAELKVGSARSIVEQARITEFREKYLQRYPSTLRNAAHVALRLYELEPQGSSDSVVIELDENDKERRAHAALYDRLRSEERARVEALMRSCTTDISLWEVMKQEVFSIPERLGILDVPPRSTVKPSRVGATSLRQRKRPSIQVEKPAREAAEPKTAEAEPKDAELEATSSAANQDANTEPKFKMDIHGPLYSEFLHKGLNLLGSAFARPSLKVFAILPRVKALGLPSYVLGISSAFYARLAEMHWDHYGDADSALEVLDEMHTTGLYAGREVIDLLVRIRNELHICASGEQGPFVAAIMKLPPYDGALKQRLRDMEATMRRSMQERTMEQAE